MLKIAVIEDDEKEAEELRIMLERFAKENSFEFELLFFKNPLVFLNNYSAKYDLIFMDIQMPHMDGVEAAKKLRQLDQVTMLIFITKMANLAGMGYDVDAFDFLVKPINYEYFLTKMERAIERLLNRREKKIIINFDGAKVCLGVSSIIYIEVINHRLIYHTENGDYNTYGTMSKVLQEIADYDFSLCNSCYLVNLRFVKSVKQQFVNVGNTELKISSPKKKSFMEALNNYIGG